MSPVMGETDAWITVGMGTIGDTKVPMVRMILGPCQAIREIVSLTVEMEEQADGPHLVGRGHLKENGEVVVVFDVQAANMPVADKFLKGLNDLHCMVLEAVSPTTMVRYLATRMGVEIVLQETVDQATYERYVNGEFHSPWPTA